MSTPNNTPNPTPTPNPNPTPEPAKTISHEEFQRLQTEKSQLESSLNSIKSELDSMKTEKMKAEGNKDEYIKTLENKLKEKDSQYETDLNKFKLSKVVSKLREEALKEGVKHTDDLQKLYGDQLKNVKVNDKFEVEGDGIKHIISLAKEKSPYLFNAPAPKVDDINQKKATPEKAQSNIRDNLRKALQSKE